jgi:hypothetical protein
LVLTVRKGPGNIRFACEGTRANIICSLESKFVGSVRLEILGRVRSAGWRDALVDSVPV